MDAKPLPDRADLLKRFGYDRLTGRLTRRKDGAESGHLRKRDGYRIVGVLGGQYQAHRIIWFMVTGEQPKEVDHINGIRSDNRLENLRGVTAAENRRNKAIQRNNKSGVTGVRRRDSRWEAKIKFKGVIHYLGNYDTLEQAAAVRRGAERRFGFHPNHSRR